MTWFSWYELWVALIATLVLSLFHVLSPWLAKQLPEKGRAYVSFAGGVAVAYVFLHMLPELVEQNEPIGHLLANYHWLSPLTELVIFIVALFGFLIYYGLELLAQANHKKHPTSMAAYWLHLLMFCLYNFLITYSMALRVATGLTFSIIFTIVMALHFVLTDQKFSRLHAHFFNHLGRLLLICALWLGWLVSVIFEPVNVLVVAMMVAFLAGSVLLNVFREELPNAKSTNYGWFVLGAFIIVMALLIQMLA